MGAWQWARERSLRDGLLHGLWAQENRCYATRQEIYTSGTNREQMQGFARHEWRFCDGKGWRFRGTVALS